MRINRLFLRRVTVLFSGASAGQAVLLAVSPVLSRIYSPADFGVFGVYLSIIGFVAAFASMRLEMAIPLQDKLSDADSILRICIAILVFTSLVSYIVLFLGGDTVFGSLDVPGSPILAAAIAIGIFGLGLYNALSMRAVFRAHYAGLSKSKALYGAGVAAIQLCSAVLGYVGLLIGDFLSRLLASGFLALSTKGEKSGRFVPPVTESFNILRKYRRFPMVAAPAAALNSAGVHVPALLVASSFGVVSAGAYIFTIRVVGAPSGLLSQAVSRVYIGELSERIRSEDRHLSRTLLFTVFGLAAIGIIPFGLLVIIGPWLFATVFGDEWRLAGEVARFVSPMLFMQFITVPVSQTLNLLEKQTTQLYWDMFRLIAVVGVFWYSVHRDYSVLECVLLLSLTTSAIYGVLLWLSWRAAQCRSRK